jgi:hypothetical protein
MQEWKDVSIVGQRFALHTRANVLRINAHGLYDGVERDEYRDPIGFDGKRLKGGEGKRHLEIDRSTLSGFGRHRDFSAGALRKISYNVESNPPTGQFGNRARGANPAFQQESHEFGRVEGCRVIDEESLPSGGIADSIEIDSPTVITTREDNVATAPYNLESHAPIGWLSDCAPLIFGLDPVHHGVADNMLKRSLGGRE